MLQSLGPDNLTADQLAAMPTLERKRYMKKMSVKELGAYWTAGMVENLNTNVQSEEGK